MLILDICFIIIQYSQDTSEPFHPRPNLYASIQNHTKAAQHLNLLPIHLQFGQKIYFYGVFSRLT